MALNCRARWQQRRHLGPGDRRVRAVPGRRGRTAHGDAGLGQRVDGGLVGAAARVGEPRGRCRAEPEGPLQEAGHLGPGYGLVRAEAGRAGLAPPGDTQLREALHVGRPPLPRRDVGEAGAARARGSRPSWARTNHTAIAQRGSGSCGQSRSNVQPVPRRIPAASSASTALRCMPASSESESWAQADGAAPNTAYEAAASVRMAPARTRRLMRVPVPYRRRRGRRPSARCPPGWKIPEAGGDTTPRRRGRRR